MESDGKTMRYQCLLDGTYWDGPYLLYENTDFKHGIFTAYTALDTLSRAQHFYAADDVLAKEVRYMSTQWNSRYDGEELPLWILEAEGADPEALLDQAANHYGFSFEKIWLPWTNETKESIWIVKTDTTRMFSVRVVSVFTLKITLTVLLV